MGRCKRPRTREYAPTNSGSKSKPERINLRCTTEQCGRALTAVTVARLLRRAPETNISEAFHEVIIPVFEHVIRAYRFGSSAEQAAAKVYLMPFVPKEDYVRNRKNRYQMKFPI